MTDAPRPVVRVSAYAVCTDPTDRLLVCRIAPGYTVGFDGWWTLPGGGLEHGEDPRDGVLRELMEETGLVGEVDALLDVDSWHTVLADRTGEPIDWHGVRILYRCRIVGGELRDEPDGSTDAARWFDADDRAREPVVDLVELAVRHLGVA